MKDFFVKFLNRYGMGVWFHWFPKRRRAMPVVTAGRIFQVREGKSIRRFVCYYYYHMKKKSQERAMADHCRWTQCVYMTNATVSSPRGTRGEPPATTPSWRLTPIAVPGEHWWTLVNIGEADEGDDGDFDNDSIGEWCTSSWRLTYQELILFVMLMMKQNCCFFLRNFHKNWKSPWQCGTYPNLKHRLMFSPGTSTRTATTPSATLRAIATTSQRLHGQTWFEENWNHVLKSIIMVMD